MEEASQWRFMNGMRTWKMRQSDLFYEWAVLNS